ncbi:very long chain fatty acid elongase 4-like [Saccoglossus kowalevskii]|uniref:Elongation of very long chain fatty acids protein n=1 Tax=Saccoglossus kowalevskii TaxID=10224 RepID=A0ABM0GMP2_SACKO|nr:PREDICTED: elongation of very long chain fatty acids protein 4-like [Saccoglossus kowalevskii]
MATSQMRELLQWVESIADPCTNEWPMVKSPLMPLLATIAYLHLIRIGQVFMDNKKPLNLKGFMLIYNAFLVGLSTFMFMKFLLAAWPRPEFSWLCQSVDYSSNLQPIRLASACWWFYISKYIEFIDTFIFILRKKNGQVTFLHLYHHATMPFLWWFVTKWIAGGSAFFSAMVNCFVHIIMYTYYTLSAIGPSMQPYLWWKRYLTKVQMIQFVTVMLHTAYVIYSNCGYPRWPMAFLIIYMASLFILFANFYSKTYVTKQTSHLKSG